jgi:hypothetical protein
MRLGGAAAALVLIAAAAPALAQGSQPGVERAPFASSVRTLQEAGFLVVLSNGIPGHPSGPFPAPRNPNRITAQNYRFYIPLRPQEAAQPTNLPRGGPIAIALSGIPLYNPNNAEGRNAVEGPYREDFDLCNGHPDPPGRYHYHQYSPCIVPNPPPRHSPVIGYAFDGFAIYGPNDADGHPPADLDTCNGHRDAQRGYHYHVSARFPYVLGCYHGTPERQNFDRPGAGPPPGGMRPPPSGPMPPPR